MAEQQYSGPDRRKPQFETLNEESLRSAPAAVPLVRDDPQSSRRTLGLALALFMFVADQVLKWIIINPLELQRWGQITLLPFFDLTWTENRGVSMGFLTAGSETERWLLVGFTAVIATIVAVWLWRERRMGDTLALGLVLGGALGNILDRVRYGFVVDFLDLHIGEWRPFLVFNLADAAISIGVAILLIRALFSRSDRRPDGEFYDA